MKKTLFLFYACFAILVFSCNSPKKNLVGKWTVHYSSGQPISVDFRENGTFESTIPADHYTVGGEYKLEGDVLSITDTSCGKNYWGKYKATFFSNDSVYSALIEDSCSGRRSAADKATLIRVK